MTHRIASCLFLVIVSGHLYSILQYFWTILVEFDIGLAMFQSYLAPWATFSLSLLRCYLGQVPSIGHPPLFLVFPFSCYFHLALRLFLLCPSPQYLLLLIKFCDPLLFIMLQIVRRHANYLDPQRSAAMGEGDMASATRDRNISAPIASVGAWVKR